MNEWFGLRGANLCVKMALHAPSQPFFHNLSGKILDIVILAFVFLHGCLRNEKLHTPSIKVRRTVAR